MIMAGNYCFTFLFFYISPHKHILWKSLVVSQQGTCNVRVPITCFHDEIRKPFPRYPSNLERYVYIASDRILKFWAQLFKTTISLVNVSLKLLLNMAYILIFLLKKCEVLLHLQMLLPFFLQKYL